MRFNAATAILIALCCGGCVLPIPHRRLHVYGIKGQVVSELDGTPIAGATVCGVMSDEDGLFSSPPRHGWHGAFLITPAIGYSLLPSFDMPLLPNRIDAYAPGYAPRMFYVRGWPSDCRVRENMNPVQGRLKGSYLLVDKLHLRPVEAGARGP